MRGAACAAAPRRRGQLGGSERVSEGDYGYQVRDGMAGDARVEGGRRGGATCARVCEGATIGRYHQLAIYEVRCR